MMVNGRDCSIVIKTAHREMDIPYSDETIREAVSFLQEEAAIEGDGVRRGIRKSRGVTGCVVTPLTIKTAPLLLYLAMGAAGSPVHVSETRDLYRYSLDLLPMEDAEHFDLIQDRGGRANGVGIRLVYEDCKVKGFELRIMREQALKLKLEIRGERSPAAYPYADTFPKEQGERFSSDFVTYRINDKEYKTIYGLTLATRKEGGTKTELWVKRAKEQGTDIPDLIEEMIITAQLLRTQYESRYFGIFRITIKRLVLIGDETEVNTDGTVISPLRYYVAGSVSTEVFSTTDFPVGC